MISAVWIGGQGKAIGKLLRLSRRLLHAFSIGPETPGHKDESLPAMRAAESPEEPEASVEIGALYRKYAASIYWVCMKYVRNKEDAEDMVNQVFIKVQQNLAGFKGQSRIYSWIYRIAVNECIQLFRKRKFEVDGAGVPDFEEMLHASPEEHMDACLLVERITREADRETVEIVFLLYLEGLTQEEVVEKLGISRTTIHRKVTAFKAKMERYR
ncbi:MAG: RNA polymerase sigma factor [Fibrobacteres bacterium]|jgi:RNA polymerase sigma-70 factor (ECF subfamily)|nr:RNA polymerase sigma factor [Fibrobacterota bacterium]